MLCHSEETDNVACSLPWLLTNCDRYVGTSGLEEWISPVTASSEGYYDGLGHKSLTLTHCICLAAHTASSLCCFTGSGTAHTAVLLSVTTAHVKSLPRPSGPWDHPWMILPSWVLGRLHGDQARAPSVRMVQDRRPLVLAQLVCPPPEMTVRGSLWLALLMSPCLSLYLPSLTGRLPSVPVILAHAPRKNTIFLLRKIR